jgi:hypothetical protein
MALSIPLVMGFRCVPDLGEGGGHGGAGAGGSRGGAGGAVAVGGAGGSSARAGAGGGGATGGGGTIGGTTTGGGGTSVGIAGSSGGSTAGAGGGAAVDAGGVSGGAGAGTSIDAGGDGSGQIGTCGQPDPNAVWEAGAGFSTTVGTVSSMWSTSSSDVWASTSSVLAGRTGTVLGGSIQHWNGTIWTSIVVPVGGQAIESLWASGPNDLWAGTSNGLWRWNGATWANVTPFPQGNDLIEKVWGLGSSDVWVARGGAGLGIFHWDGATWTDRSISTSIPAPSDAPPQTGTAFFTPFAFWGATTADVWTSGAIIYPLFPTGPGTLARVDLTGYAHWDGAAWTVESPATVAEARFGDIVDVHGTAADDIWAIGNAEATMPEIIEHYDGVSWTRLSNVPSVGGLNSLWGSCSSDFWAVGDSSNGEAPVVLHFDGSVWAIVPSPFIPSTLSLNAVTGTDANDVWLGGGAPSNPTTVLIGFAYHRHL